MKQEQHFTGKDDDIHCISISYGSWNIEKI